MDKTDIKKYFGARREEEITQLIESSDNFPSDIRFKNPKITLLLSIFLGFAGMDRLYQSGIKVFLCKLAMLIFSMGTWWFVDIGYSVRMTQDVNYNSLMAAYK